MFELVGEAVGGQNLGLVGLRKVGPGFAQVPLLKAGFIDEGCSSVVESLPACTKSWVQFLLWQRRWSNVGRREEWREKVGKDREEGKLTQAVVLFSS